MPKIRKYNSKEPPKGWNEIEPTLTELNNQLKEISLDTSEGKRKQEALWPLLRIHHHMSRYVYELYYFNKEISKELYEYCINEKWIDKNLIAKWKKTGYEKLCCLLCIQQKDHNFNTTCICRVPKSKLDEGKFIECNHCGCRGCSSSDI